MGAEDSKHQGPQQKKGRWFSNGPVQLELPEALTGGGLWQEWCEADVRESRVSNRPEVVPTG